jgi:hypothetical protein
VLDTFRSELHIVTVNGERTADTTEEYQIQKSKLEAMLSGYSCGFHFIMQDNFSEAISQYAADNHIDLILIVPRTHSFLASLFSSSHTRTLAYHSHVPILAIHE